MIKSLTPFLLLAFFACKGTDGNQPRRELKPNSPAAQLKELVSQYPDSLLLTESLVQLYRDSGWYDQAIAETKRVLAKDSSNNRFWRIQAILQLENEDTLPAIASFEKAFQLQPDIPAVIALATVYAQTKNKQALALSDLLLKQYGTLADKEAYFIKGLYYTYNNEKQTAIHWFDEALKTSITFTDAYREKAIALYDMGKYEEALAVLNKAITLNNSFDEGYYYKGQCLEKLHQPDEAMDAYNLALMYSPDYTEAKTALQRLQAGTPAK